MCPPVTLNFFSGHRYMLSMDQLWGGEGAMVGVGKGSRVVTVMLAYHHGEERGQCRHVSYRGEGIYTIYNLIL